MKNILFLVLLFTLSFTIQANAQRHPKSYEYQGVISAPPAIQTVLLPAVNADSLKQDDTLRKKENRVGIRQSVSINPELQGTVDELPDGGRLWRMRFVSPGASTHSFLFSTFHLAEGVEMWVYGEDGDFEVQGPFTSKNNKLYRRFTVGSTFGSIHIIEVYEPPSAIHLSELLLSSVYQGYRGSTIPPPPDNNQFTSHNQKDKNIQRDWGSTAAGAICNPNVNCPYGKDWCREKKAVCHIEQYEEEESVCTGTLVNNTANDKKPYILSAWHCLIISHDLNCTLSSDELSQVEDWVFVFNWWSNRNEDCADPGTKLQATANVGGKQYHGAEIKAKYRQTDMLLLEVVPEGNEDLSGNSLDFYFAGWSRSTTTPLSGTNLHHPQGDIMKIAQCTTSAHIHNYGQGSDCSTDNLDNSIWPSSSNFWDFVWDIGHNENRSSGSAVFDESHRVRGQLSSIDDKFCEEHPQSARFGKFDLSWEGDGTNSYSRLKDWLDPLSIDPPDWAGISSDIFLYNHSTGSETKYLDITDPVPVARYYATTSLTLEGGKDWTNPSDVPTSAAVNQPFEFSKDTGGDVSAGRRIDLKQCLIVLERDYHESRVRFYIADPQCETGVQDTPQGFPVFPVVASDPTPSSGTCVRTYGRKEGSPREKLSDQPFKNTTITADEVLRVVPNPASTYLTILGLDGTGAKIQVFNTIGIPLLEQDIIGKNPAINIEGLANGTYFLRVEKSGRIVIKPFMVIK